MERGEEEDAMAKSAKPAAGCRSKHARLHTSFLHLSKAIKRLHARRGHGNAAGEPVPPSASSASTAASSSSFLSGCMHPRTQSFATGRQRHRGHAAAGRRCSPGSEDDRDALAVNFRSLRVGGTADAAVADRASSSSSAAAAKDEYYSDGGSDEEGGRGVPASPRAAAGNKAVMAGGAGGGVAVATFSAAPYEDFRRSMREMVDAAAGSGGAGGAGAGPAVDWDLMEELLFCYLRLNDRAVHRDILRAFADTVAALRRRRRAAAKSRRRARQQRRRRRRGAREDDGRDGDGAEEAAPSP